MDLKELWYNAFRLTGDRSRCGYVLFHLSCWSAGSWAASLSPSRRPVSAACLAQPSDSCSCSEGSILSVLHIEHTFNAKRASAGGLKGLLPVSRTGRFGDRE